MNRKIFILLGIFILSRVLFINPLPVFFDSPEYLSRFSNPNYFQAIVSGHMPFHAGYIMLFWPVFQGAINLNLNPSFAIIFTQIIFSAIAMYCFYRFVETITNEKIAITTTIITSLLPIYWITNVTIMVETAYINFIFISLFFLSSYAKKKAHSKLNLIIGSASLGLALLTNPLVILWMPFLLSVVYLLKKGKIVYVLPAIIIATILTILINGFFVAKFLQIPVFDGIYKYLFDEDLNVMPNISSFLMILRFIRNAFLPVLQNNTAIILLLSIISLLKVFKINKKLFIVAFLWIFPSLIVNQWFNPLLSGRHGIIADFGFAFLAGIFLEKRKILFYIVIIYILIVSLPALSLLKQPMPYLVEQKFVQTLPKGLLIESHFARPQIEGHYSGKVIFINQPGWNKKELEVTIDNYLNSKKPVFITSQALSDPYGLYSGPFLLPLSLSYAKNFELEDIILSYSVKNYATIDKNAGLYIYKIISKEKSQYPLIPILKYNRHRIDYFDPISQLWFLIERAKIIQIHNIIKE